MSVVAPLVSLVVPTYNEAGGIEKLITTLAEVFKRDALDGEIVVVVGERLEFEVLQQRIHPATSRVTRLSRETPASFIAFDSRARGDEGCTTRPFAQRRELPVVGVGDGRPPLANRSLHRIVQAEEQPCQRRFATSSSPQQAQYLTWR